MCVCVLVLHGFTNCIVIAVNDHYLCSDVKTKTNLEVNVVLFLTIYILSSFSWLFRVHFARWLRGLWNKNREIVTLPIFIPLNWNLFCVPQALNSLRRLHAICGLKIEREREKKKWFRCVYMELRWKSLRQLSPYSIFWNKQQDLCVIQPVWIMMIRKWI